MRALFVSAGNPVLSVPDGDALERGARQARPDACRSTSTSTRRTATPTTSCRATTFLERDDVPVAFLGFYTTPFIQYTDAVVPPRGEAREEWEIIDDAREAVGVAPYSVPAAAAPGAPGRAAHPAAAGSTCCCAPARRRPVRRCAAAG